MYKNILAVLRCPHCGAKFQLMESKSEYDEVVEGKVVCEKGCKVPRGKSYGRFRKNIYP